MAGPKPMKGITRTLWSGLCGWAVVLTGCGDSAPPVTVVTADPKTERLQPGVRDSAPSAVTVPVKSAVPTKAAAEPGDRSREKAQPPAGKPARPPRSLADLLPPEGQGAAPTIPATPVEVPSLPTRGLGPAFAADQPITYTPPKIDEARVAAAGLRKIAGRHLTLYTDVPMHPDVEELPEIFDQAVPQWSAYFALKEEQWRNWQVVGSLMRDRSRFERAGLMVPGLPEFTRGYQSGLQIWVEEQESTYYRRHLLLHEGTHAVMNTLVGGTGPPWYSEGISELLATHRWHDKRLTLQSPPRSRDEAPGWGRIKIIRDDMAADRGKLLEVVMRYGPEAHLQVEPYGWCWAACSFLDAHPKSQAAFRDLRKDVRDTSLDFSRRFYYLLRNDWAELAEDWQVFLANAEYGYDFRRNLIERKPSAPLPATGATVRIKVDHGWQSTGWQLESNHAYEFVARGRYRVVAEPEPLEAEPGGITLRYHQGFPLGMLLGAIRPDVIPAGALTPLATPDDIGLGRRAVMERSGTLYLRINDAPGEMADNQGEVTVEIRPVQLPSTR